MEEINWEFLVAKHWAGIVNSKQYPNLWQISAVAKATIVNNQWLFIVPKDGSGWWFNMKYVDIIKAKYPGAKWFLSSPLSNGRRMLCTKINEETFAVLCGLKEEINYE